MSEYGDYTNRVSSLIQELPKPPKGCWRTLDEVEIYYKTDPVLMAKLHSGDGYYGENKNPYEKGTGNWNIYENAFETMRGEK
jgi:hypothetical protein